MGARLQYWLIKWTLGKLHLLKVALLFNRLAASILGVRVVYAGVYGKPWFDRLLYFQGLFDLLEGVEGDVVECGVATGYSLSILASLVRSSDINRHIWGFDSWAGLPEPSKEDLTSTKSYARKGMFGNASAEFILERLRWCEFKDSEIKNRITLVKGLFSDTLPKYKGPNIALLHIDADLYNSYKDVLQFLWPKVSIGGIVAFDEYESHTAWPGARQAVDEFLGQLAPEGVRLNKSTSCVGKYYVVKLA